VYDETYQFLRKAIDRAKLGISDRQKAIKGLVPLLYKLEKDFIPSIPHFNKFVATERKESGSFGGKTAAGKSAASKTADRKIRSVKLTAGHKKSPADIQLSLFS
jgi:hypothetical protein